MKRFLKRALRWSAILLTILVLLLIFFYAEENWRGARDWATCQQNLTARGETLDLSRLTSPADPKNDLSKVSIFAELYQDEEALLNNKISPVHPRIDLVKTDLVRPSHGNSTPHYPDISKGELTDIVSWQKFYRATPEAHLPGKIGTPAQDVLSALAQFDPDLAEIDIAISNPNAYWPVNKPSEDHMVTYVGGMTTVAQLSSVLRLKAVAHLENQAPDLAEQDYLFCLRLNRPLTNQVTLINFECAISVQRVAHAILFEGLHRHAWNLTQLGQMEAELGKADLLAFALDGIRTDRTSMLEYMNLLQRLHWDVVNEAETSDTYYYFGLHHLPLSRVRPAGWWNIDRSTYSLDIQKHIDAIHLKEATISTDAFPYRDMSDSWGWNHPQANFWSSIYVPVTTFAMPYFDNLGHKIARAETYRRLARLACRLEEYRIAHGQYPEKLDELPGLPAHLNQEVLSQQPLQYHQKGDTYQLYSLGWDQKDDGGKWPSISENDGDWSWPGP